MTAAGRVCHQRAPANLQCNKEASWQTVARNIAGKRERFDAVPFFWSAHFDVVIAYVGHGSGSDDVEVRGSLDQNDAAVIYRRDGRITAVATIGRDLAALEAEREMERDRA